MKKTALMVCGVMILAFSAFNSNAEKRSLSDQQFNTIKSLVGNWEGYKDNDKKKPVVLSYELSGAGSAVVEKIFKGTPQEMVTVYHKNGDKVMLSHYCALGNQPRMGAAPTGDGKKIAFEFIDGSNMDAKKDAHMHSLTLTSISAGKLKQEWTSYDKGKAGPVSTFSFTRKTEVNE